MDLATMRFASGISDAINAQEAVDTACQQALEPLAGQSCDLACLFVSPAYGAYWPPLLERLQERLKPRVVIGCSGSGIIGGGRELEAIPAVSVVAAHLPGVRLHPFVVTPDEIELSAPGGFWIDKIGVAPASQPVFILFAAPLSCQPLTLLDTLNATYRGRPIVGGLVSGGTGPGEQFLFMGPDVVREGAVGVALSGNIAMDTVVSQGCRPIGRPYVVTKAEDTIVWELGGKSALSVLHEVLSALSPEDRELAQRGSIFIGLAITEMRQAFLSGDFLVRNIVGLDPASGALAVAEAVRVGQTLQFQLRDPRTSGQELRRLLHRLGSSGQEAAPAGCLLFNCTGRGKSLYGVAHHDVRTIQTAKGTVPIGGVFCSGEIGPVGETNFLHGYTASLGLFRPLAVPWGGLPQQALPNTTEQDR